MCIRDSYAAGAVLYQMLTGERPVESLERIEKDKLITLTQKGITVRPHVENAVMKALSLDPEQRFKSAEMFRLAILEPEKKGGWKWWSKG